MGSAGENANVCEDFSLFITLKILSEHRRDKLVYGTSLAITSGTHELHVTTRTTLIGIKTESYSSQLQSFTVTSPIKRAFPSCLG